MDSKQITSMIMNLSREQFEAGYKKGLAESVKSSSPKRAANYEQLTFDELFNNFADKINCEANQVHARAALAKASECHDSFSLGHSEGYAQGYDIGYAKAIENSQKYNNELRENMYSAGYCKGAMNMIKRSSKQIKSYYTLQVVSFYYPFYAKKQGHNNTYYPSWMAGLIMLYTSDKRSNNKYAQWIQYDCKSSCFLSKMQYDILTSAFDIEHYAMYNSRDLHNFIVKRV